ncbi:glycosyltransferase, partial [Streptococcus porcinus]
YSVIEKENCGYCAKNQTPEEVAKALVDLAQNENEARTQGENSKQQSINFDFENLTNKLIEVIER